jgi:hypothetical protein
MRARGTTVVLASRNKRMNNFVDSPDAIAHGRELLFS